MKKYFTTPIYYVNDIPHIGHAYCTVATDTIARYWRTKIGNDNVFFVTGTDENSQKTVEAAQKNGQSIPDYLEEMASTWKTTWEQCGMQFDDFIRTTEDRHIQSVHEVLQTIYDTKDIYKGQYKGKYCTGCETFLKDADLDENGCCPDHKTKPEIIEEENYFFKLSAYQDQLIELYEKNPNLLQPEKRRNEVLSFIKSGLEDISISREGKAFGIKLPWDKNHAVYVWFDALINYYTAITDRDGKDAWNKGDITHILGKDITKFHCIIWPAMLISAGLTPPKEMFAHGFFTVNGTKMSKSLGNVISPLELSKKYGNDALRVGLLSNFEFGNDGDFSLEHFHNLYAKKLAGGVGNIFNRIVVLIHKFWNGEKPKNWDSKKFTGFGGGTLRKELTQEDLSLQSFENACAHYKLKHAIDILFNNIEELDVHLSAHEPWKKIKIDEEETKKIMSFALQKLENITKMAEVLLPETYPKMKSMLGDTTKVGEKGILFPQIEKK